MSSSAVVSGGIFSTRNVNGRFRSIESMMMTISTSSYVAPLMSLVDLSLVSGWWCEMLRSHVWRVQTLAGMRLSYGLLIRLRRMRKVSYASCKASHIKGVLSYLHSISLVNIIFDMNHLEYSNEGDTKMSRIRALRSQLAG